MLHAPAAGRELGDLAPVVGTQVRRQRDAACGASLLVGDAVDVTPLGVVDDERVHAQLVTDPVDPGQTVAGEHLQLAEEAVDFPVGHRDLERPHVGVARNLAVRAHLDGVVAGVAGQQGLHLPLRVRRRCLVGHGDLGGARRCEDGGRRLDRDRLGDGGRSRGGCRGGVAGRQAEHRGDGETDDGQGADPHGDLLT